MAACSRSLSSVTIATHRLSPSMCRTQLCTPCARRSRPNEDTYSDPRRFSIIGLLKTSIAFALAFQTRHVLGKRTWFSKGGEAIGASSGPSTTVRVPRRSRWTRGVLRRTDESYEGAVSPPRRLFVGAAEKRPQTSSAHLMLPGGPCTQSDEDLMTIGSCMSVLATGARGAVASLPRRGGVAPRPGRR